MHGGEIRILIADDHGTFRRTLRQIVGGEPGLVIVAECADGIEALENAEREHPDIAVLDIEMPGLDGIAVSAQLAGTATRVVLLTMYGDVSLLRRARESGALGYVLKENAAFELVPAIRMVMRGSVFAGQRCSAFEGEL